MPTPTRDKHATSRLWEHHHGEWRDPGQIASQWREANQTDPRLLRSSADDRWWTLVDRLGVTLIVTREYEHLLMAVSTDEGRPRVTYTALPHPSGVVFDRDREIVHVASTRNPNQIYDFAAVVAGTAEAGERPLLPVRSRLLPGSLYLHDLALVGRRLHASAVGHNAVIVVRDDATWERVWWPSAIERPDGPDFTRNYLQLNSIAAGEDLAASYFSASTDRVSARRPGHLNFPVDGRGVIFGGHERRAVVRGLTRPHSARLHDGRLWVNNSGYGEVGVASDGGLEVVARLPGWTRGLGFVGDVAFVGTSRVIPRFRRYAPGLDLARSVCGVHAIDTRTGEGLGRIVWPIGNQIFAIEPLPAGLTSGLPFRVGSRRQSPRIRRLFSSFSAGSAPGKDA